MSKILLKFNDFVEIANGKIWHWHVPASWLMSISKFKNDLIVMYVFLFLHVSVLSFANEITLSHAGCRFYSRINYTVKIYWQDIKRLQRNNIKEINSKQRVGRVQINSYVYFGN